MLTIYAGNGSSSYSGDGGPAIAAGLPCMGMIAMDPLGNLYISDGANRIRKINTAGIINTIAGTDLVGFSGDGGPATAAQLNAAATVFPDNCGNFYIGDGYNNRIRKVDGHGIITTFAGNGTQGFTGDGGQAIAAEFYHPGVYLDKNGNIYIGDAGNYSVRYIKMDSCKSVMEAPTIHQGEEVVSVFPNPVNDELHITGVTENVKYSILNVAGMCLQQGSLKKGENILSLRYFAQGIYILEVISADGVRSMHRVVKE